MTNKAKQLANVAFGGNWSEAIMEHHDIETALDVLRNTAQNCRESACFGSELEDALATIRAYIDKGEGLTVGFLNALNEQNIAQREKEVRRYLFLIERQI